MCEDGQRWFYPTAEFVGRNSLGPSQAAHLELADMAARADDEGWPYSDYDDDLFDTGKPPIPITEQEIEERKLRELRRRKAPLVAGEHPPR